MHPALIVFLIALALVIVLLVRAVQRAGPRQLPETDLRRGRTVVALTAEAPGPGWGEVGSATTVRGIDLRFDSDDDPAARATLLAPESQRGTRGNLLSNKVTISLTGTFETHHVHTSGWVFRVTLRGTGKTVGRQVQLGMAVDKAGRPWGGRIENDDDTKAAIADWIEIRRAELLTLG